MNPLVTDTEQDLAGFFQLRFHFFHRPLLRLGKRCQTGSQMGNTGAFFKISRRSNEWRPTWDLLIDSSQHHIDFPRIKSNPMIITNHNHRHLPFAGNINHFLQGPGLLAHIKHLIIDPFLRKILFRCLTMGSGGKGINFNCNWHFFTPYGFRLSQPRVHAGKITLGCIAGPHWIHISYDRKGIPPVVPRLESCSRRRSTSNSFLVFPLVFQSFLFSLINFMLLQKIMKPPAG